MAPVFRKAISLFSGLGILFLAGLPAWAGGKDFVVFTNGDKVTGELKSLDQGILKFSTNYSENDFEIKWEEVRQIKSDRPFIFTLHSGERFTGSLVTKSSKPLILQLGSSDGDKVVSPENLLLIEESGNHWLNRAKASFDFGYNQYQADGQKQFSFGAAASYLTSDFFSELQLSVLRTTYDVIPKTERNSALVGTRRFMSHNWFATSYLELLQSDEQAVDLRSTWTLGMGNNLYRSHHAFFALTGGVAWTRETFTENTASQDHSAEGLGKMEFNAFDLGDLSFLAKVAVYPSLTIAHRVRADVNSELKWDLPKDFYVKFSYNLNTDNRPPPDGVKSDYVLSSAFGWEL
jgi:hypothetical protein